jgi:hypothetical protein
MIYHASVKDNQIVFPGGASYRLLVLPDFETMTPGLLKKIKELVQDGATVVGLPPKKSPGLTNYPDCDNEVQKFAKELWGNLEIPVELTTQSFGNGKIIWGSELKEKADNLYPHYDITASILVKMNVQKDFTTKAPVRYTHRTMPGCDIYFVANRTEKEIKDECLFRITGKKPELWDPITGETRPLPEYSVVNGVTNIPLEFRPYESYFIVFGSNKDKVKGKNFTTPKILAKIDAPWDVSFDPAWGGPEKITFEKLTDWTQHPDPGIKYYSGTAVYRQKFDLPDNSNGRIYLDFGKVKNMARIHINGKEAGTLWTSPWQLDITDFVKQTNNELKVEVINLWPNRLIGDEQLPDDGIQKGQWPEWLLKGEARHSERYTFTTYKHYTKDSPLLESGLIGPVTIQIKNTE